MNQGVIIGLISFVIWCSASSWWYVCKIRNLCEEPSLTDIQQEIPATNEPLEELKRETIDSTKVAQPVVLVPLDLKYSNIYFEKNASTPSNQSVVVELSQIIKDTLRSRKPTITITGHTCNLGTQAHNYQLGLLRAQNISDLLRSEGLTYSFSVLSKGEEQPLTSNASESERARNRRVELTIKTN